MEPRPQSNRSAHGQPAPRQPAAHGRGPEETVAYQPQPDPTTIVAPPRTDYDYSPLDLAPPGQRRRRQLVAAGLGALVMLLLAAAAVFAFLVLNDDDGDDQAGLAAAQTVIAATEAANQPSTPAPTTAPAGGGAAGEETAAPEATVGVDEGGQQAALQPTQPQQAPAGTGPTVEEMTALLPGPELMPQGLEAQADASLAQEDVVAALGGSREAETNLTDWGWSGNIQRSYTAPDPAALAPDATTDITISLHGFSSDAAAAEALTFYSDILVSGGYQEVEVGEIGATNRMLTQPGEDGSTTVALYIQQGSVLYRIGGYSPAGDPTQNVVNLATAMLAQ